MNYIQPNFNQQLPISALAAHIGQTVSIKGSVYKIREMRGFAFVQVMCQNTLVQCIYMEQSPFPLCEIVENMTGIFSGYVTEDRRSRLGFELQLTEVTALSIPYEPCPVVINHKELPLSIDTLLDYRPLTLRNEGEKAIFKLQEGLVQGIRAFLSQKQFTEIRTPKIVAFSAEGGANIFKLDYFGKEAYLAQSPQFYKQMMTGVFERVFEIAPVFRAEKHHTSRHINEYTSVDLELGYIDHFTDIMALECEMLSFTLNYVKENCSEALEKLSVKLPTITQIPAITFHNAKELIGKTYEKEITDWLDFEPEEERQLCDLIFKQTGCEFVFVTHYPRAKRPFYTKDTVENPGVTDSFDLLFRGLEITTGGQRIHEYAPQLAKMASMGMSQVGFEDFLMAHKYGLPPHGGFGLGLERLTAQLIGMPNIRRATMFPRDVSRLTP